MEMIDGLALTNDKELLEGLRWIDGQARKSGTPFYEMCWIIFRKHMAERRAMQWNKARHA